MKILITGDLVINREYNKSDIDDCVISLFGHSDLNIVNLEAPVTSSSSTILKTGPHLKANPLSTMNVLKSLNIGVATLANNHILDYNEQGLKDTLSFCNENNIRTVGTGRNLNEAAQTLYIHTMEAIIAIVNFAENEWASATDMTAGANPMDIIDNSSQIRKAKANADFVFVIVHGGHEYYNLPSPRMQKQYRFYAEQGADMIIGHHTHCITGYEVWRNVPIYYSLGNFIFTNSSIYEDWYTGLVLEVEILKGKLFPKLYPIKQEKENFAIHLLKNEEKQEVFSRISFYNSIISDSSKLQNQWEIFINLKYNSYLNYWSPFSFIRNRYLKALLRKMKIKGINKNGLKLTLNLLRCEAHADLSKEILRKYLL